MAAGLSECSAGWPQYCTCPVNIAQNPTLFNMLGTLPEKWGTGVCCPQEPFFMPSWSFVRPPFQNFLVLQDHTFTPKSQSSKPQSLKICRVQFQSLNWTKLQFTWVHFVQKIQFTLGSQIRQWPVQKAPLFGPLGHTPIPKWKLSANLPGNAIHVI